MVVNHVRIFALFMLIVIEDTNEIKQYWIDSLINRKSKAKKKRKEKRKKKPMLASKKYQDSGS